ncbi:hypothetical protein DFH05DRAFT_1176408 [Lentinula detonsa]|uniref:Uncharacterized protein n=1 Tax=Lentinula detonsa TaxID=2804962 RepID=A0A9W8P060_9AGAR|nr:hypothetical protein DFH05DRAFT_1176408 [Lentinula detonsa]
MSLFQNLREFAGKRSIAFDLLSLLNLSLLRDTMLFSISYVLLGLIAVIHAIPVDSPSGQTAPSHPPHAVAVSLLDPHHPQPQSQQIPEDKIDILFLNPDDTGTGSTPKIKKEIKLIVEMYREHMNVKKPFELSFENRYSGDINDNFHDFIFWGQGDGWDCKTEESPCGVLYNPLAIWRKSDPQYRMASIHTSTRDDSVLDVTYAIRHRALSDSVHPVG